MPWVPISDVPPPWRHGACTMLAPGSIILPGNSGRLVSALYTPDHYRPRAEAIYEQVRREVDEELPSRLTCTFLSPNAHDASAFVNSDRAFFDQWYDVEPVEPTGRVFITGLNLWKCGEDLTDEELRGHAERYWTVPPLLGMRELLYPGPLRVVGFAEGPAEFVRQFTEELQLREKLQAVASSAPAAE